MRTPPTPPTRWKDGLAEWNQDGARIARLKAAADVTVYTPGSRIGTPLAVLGSLGPVAADAGEDAQSDIATTASSLLGLVGIEDAQPHSREQALLAAILSSRPAGGRGRSAVARAADPASVVRQHRRARPRDVLSGARATGTGASLQQRARGARLRRVERRRSARRGIAALHALRASRASPSSRSRTWTTRSACSWSRSCSTPCLRWTRRQSGHQLAAGAGLHGRSVRLSAAGRQSPIETAAAHAAQAGARVWRRRSSWRRRTQSISTTRRCRTPAPGSSASCRPSATRHECSTVSRACRPGLDRQSIDRALVVAPRTCVPDAQRPRAGAGRV